MALLGCKRVIKNLYSRNESEMENNETENVTTPFSSFAFSWLHAKRKQQLNSVMPVNPGFSYAAFLTDAHLKHLDSDISINGLDSLCSSLHEKSAMSALIGTRKSGSLTEGKKFLPIPIVEFLMSVGGADLYVRFDDEGGARCSPFDAKFLSINILASLPVRSGEFEICDSKGRWYLRFRDDDAVMFFAAKSDLLDKLIETFPASCIEVPPDFIYSY